MIARQYNDGGPSGLESCYREREKCVGVGNSRARATLVYGVSGQDHRGKGGIFEINFKKVLTFQRFFFCFTPAILRLQCAR